MSNTVNGKKPLSQKQAPGRLNLESIFGNTLGLADDIKETLAKNNLAYRFIGYQKLSSMGGYHERGWRPVTRKELKEMGCDKLDSHAFLIGSDPDGLIRRGDLCLAVRPSEIHSQHKAWLRERADAQSSIQRTHAERLRKSSVAGVSIREGYEDENN